MHYRNDLAERALATGSGSQTSRPEMREMGSDRREHRLKILKYPLKIP
jgi:hypothetical protein